MVALRQRRDHSRHRSGELTRGYFRIQSDTERNTSSSCSEYTSQSRNALWVSALGHALALSGNACLRTLRTLRLSNQWWRERGGASHYRRGLSRGYNRGSPRGKGMDRWGRERRRIQPTHSSRRVGACLVKCQLIAADLGNEDLRDHAAAREQKAEHANVDAKEFVGHLVLPAVRVRLAYTIVCEGSFCELGAMLAVRSKRRAMELQGGRWSSKKPANIADATISRHPHAHSCIRVLLDGDRIMTDHNEGTARQSHQQCLHQASNLAQVGIFLCLGNLPVCKITREMLSPPLQASRTACLVLVKFAKWSVCSLVVACHVSFIVLLVRFC